jgi:hypothetical protein
MGEASAITKGADGEKAREMAQQILTEARKIRDIIRKMENLHDYVTKSFPGHTILDMRRDRTGRVEPKNKGEHGRREQVLLRFVEIYATGSTLLFLYR